MNQEIKKLWLEALRSGQYTQGRVALKSIEGDGTNKYCCLGVLCDLYAQRYGATWTKGSTTLMDGKSYLVLNGNTGGFYLPPEVRKWADMESHDGRLKDKIEYETSNGRVAKADCLATLNDHANYNFEQIAEVIERQL